MFSKKEKTYSLSRNFFYNTIGTVLLRGIGLITTPIIANILTTAEYGNISTYNLWSSFLGIFIGIQSVGTLNNALLDYTEKEYKKYLSNILFMSFLSMVVCYIPFLLFTEKLETLLKLQSGLGLLLVPQCFFQFCINFLSSYFVAHKQSLRNLVLSLIVTISSSVLSIVFLKNASQHVTGFIAGNFLAVSVIGAGILSFLLWQGKSFFRFGYWKYCLSISVPLIFHSLSGLVLGQSDALMLRYIRNESVMGAYSFVLNISSVLTAIYSALNHSWIPFYFDFLTAGKEQLDLMLRKIKNFDFTFLYLAIGFILVSPEFIKLISSEAYWQGIKVIPFIVTGLYFVHLYGFSVNFEFFHRNTKWVAVGTVSATLLNILLNVCLIPSFGDIGAAVVTMISYILLFIFHNIIAKKKFGGFPVSNRLFFRSLIQLAFADIIFFVCYDLWVVRWILAVMVGIILLRRWIKQRSLI